MGFSALQKEPQIPTTASHALKSGPSTLLTLRHVLFSRGCKFRPNLALLRTLTPAILLCLQRSSHLATSLTFQVRLHVPIRLDPVPVILSLSALFFASTFITICNYIFV